jgi:hypothetical protein
MGRGDRLVPIIGSIYNLALAARNVGLDRDSIILNPSHMGEITDSTLATAMKARMISAALILVCHSLLYVYQACFPLIDN